MYTIAGYQIIEVIDEEPQSVIYRALRPADQQTVILKTLRAQYPPLEAVARLKHEYEITDHLDIAGVIKPYPLEKYEHGLVLVLEDFDAESLKKIMAADKIDLPTFFKIAIQLAETLGMLHQKNIIHKDIKPGNILMNQATGQVKITDFGLASRLTHENQQLSHSNLLEGSLVYMSPEQTGRMNREIDYRTDFYSLGVTFYELLTGQLPFETTDPIALVHAHIAKQPTPPHTLVETIPIMVSEIVLKLLAKTAEDRYQSAYGLKADLESCLAQWKATGKIESFRLGHYDHSERFQIPQKLYGREQQIATLLAAFERVSTPPLSPPQGGGKKKGVEMMLVTGYSGIGKSALVGEIYKPITQRRGYFITGKFDQFQRNVPYSAIVKAFSDLVRQLLAESETQLSDWRKRLLTALGSNGQIIVEVIPEVELIIGLQPSAPALALAEAQNRFDLVWERFISVFTAPEHPLVIFLDDLQWADSASLHIIQRLMTNPDSQYLFLIGAYRDNEVSAAHPLQLTLAKIEAEGAKISRISLNALDMADLNQLIADTLDTEIESTRALAELVFSKTHGNPFFVLEFLKTLYQEKLVWFVPPSISPRGDQGRVERGAGWQWNLAKIQELGLSDNVVELMAGKIQKLSPSTQAVLKLAACIGNSFDLKTLATVYETSPGETITELSAAIQAGLILGSSDFGLTLHYLAEAEARSPAPQSPTATFRFLHDRVQQAAYSLIEEDQKKAVHLTIGRLLWKEMTDDKAALTEKIFDLVNHLNFGVDLLTTPADKNQLARFNLMASQKAKAATAYTAALNYAKTGLSLLPQDTWQSHYDLTVALNLERAEAEYLSGNFEAAVALSEVILQNAQTNQDRQKVYDLKITLYTGLDRHEAALKVGFETAKLLGLNLSTMPSRVDLIREFIKTKKYLWGKKKADLLHLPAMTDPQQLAIMNLLMNLSSAAFLSNRELAVLITLKMFNSSLKYGLSQTTPYGYMIYGLINTHIGNYPTAYEFGQLALALNQKLNNVTLEHTLNFIFGSGINHWCRHTRTGIDYLSKAYQAALEVGDLNFADYSLGTLMLHSFYKGDPLDQVWAKCEQYFDFFKRMKGSHFTDIQGQDAILQRQQILSLRGLTKAEAGLSDAYFDEDKFVAELKENLTFFLYYSIKLLLLYIFEVYPQALNMARQMDKKAIEAAILIGDIGVPYYYFYYSLTLTALYSKATAREKKEYWQILRRNQKKLKMWAENCPENSLHKYLLVAAEMARISGQDEQAMDLYDQAIESAHHNEYIQNEALANELAAKFYLAKAKPRIARVYMLEARYGYLKWGATAKIRALAEKYPQLLAHIPVEIRAESATTTTLTSSDASYRLDLMTVLKAARAISSEILLSRLLTNLMKILIENAGAQRGYLILEEEGRWVIEAEGRVAEAKALQSMPVETSERLSVAIINYVARTKEYVVLNDASHEGMFTKDPYISHNEPKSILCAPLINQGKLTGILYLENNLTTGAFTPDRLEVLNILSAQAAISIENARLYTHQVELTHSASRFVPQEFLQFLHKDSIVKVNLGDQVQQNMTILVSDIRSFTTLSETMTPQENFDFVNAYLGRVSPIIRQHNGLIAKYMGDGMMAIFPRRVEDALNAAIAQLGEMAPYNAERRQQGQLPIQIGIGVHTGTVMLGTVGEAQRMQLDLFSDAVNVAVRLEGLSKLYGVPLIISTEALQRLVEPDQYQVRFLGKTHVKGRQEMLSVFEVFDGDPEETITLKLETKADFEKGLSLYYDWQFVEAKAHFEQVLQCYPADKASQFYLKRMADFTEPRLPVEEASAAALTEP